MARREYGSGSIYQRGNGRWIGTIDNGFTESGARRRVSVSGKTEAEVKRKLRDKRASLDRHETQSSRATVKIWAEQYLDMRVHDLAPKAYNAAASPIRRWVIPTIGHRRLSQLTPADVRAVHDACRRADKQAADVHRALHTMLEAAVSEGHVVAPQVLKVKAPASPKSDRQAMSVDQGIACLAVAQSLPHGSRWLFTLLYGQRLGECLGLTWDAITFDEQPGAPFGEAVIEWQLQALPYNRQRDRSSGFRVPDGYEARHLVDSFHLVRPKSRSGYRVAPLLEPVRDSLMEWQKIAPDNPGGLVWPNLKGRPANDKHDREEWHALQATAGVTHPTRLEPHPFFHVHECRNFAATMLLDAGVPEHVVTDLLGHSSVATSLRYRTRRREPLMEAMQRVGERLQLH